MSSGVGVNDECQQQFQKLKLGKSLQYIIFKLSDDKKEIIVEKAVDKASYDDFIGELPADDCRWAVYDFEYDTGESGKRNKIVFYAWSPDDAKIKSKMLYASSKDALRRTLVGIHVEIQGTDFSEVSHETVLEKASKGFK